MVDGTKRKSERRPMFRVVRYSIDNRHYADLSTNVSDGGMFIKNFSPPPIGTRVTMAVKLPEEWGNLPLQVNGIVVHVDDDPDPHKRGMGVQFVSVEADSLPLIEYFVREVYGEKLEGDRVCDRECEEEKARQGLAAPHPPAAAAPLSQPAPVPAPAQPAQPVGPGHERTYQAPQISSDDVAPVEERLPRYGYDVSQLEGPSETSYQYIRKKPKS